MKQRIGTLVFDLTSFRKTSTETLERIFAGFVPLNVETDLSCDRVKISGTHASFAEISVGEIVPEYTATVGKHSVTFEPIGTRP